MTIYKKTFVVGNHAVAQVTIQFIVSFVNSPGKLWSTGLILDALQALTLGIIKRLY